MGNNASNDYDSMSRDIQTTRKKRQSQIDV